MLGIKSEFSARAWKCSYPHSHVSSMLYSFKKHFRSWVVVVHVFNPSTQEAGAGRSLWVRDQSGLQGEFQDSQSYYTKKPCLEERERERERERSILGAINMAQKVTAFSTQAQWSEFVSFRKRKIAPESYLQPSTCAPWHVHKYHHSHTHQ